ncbi:MAG: DUF1553 domain-containing protein [Pirellulaceae bacterium]
MNQRSIRFQSKSFWIVIGALSALLCLRGTGTAEPADKLPAVFAGKVEYQRDILPIFKQHCLGCHGAAKQESGLRLDSPASLLRGGDLGEAAVLPGKSQLSLLIRVVAGLEEDLKMPPKGARLSNQEIGKLRAWIDQEGSWRAQAPGDHPAAAAAASHWAYQPVVRPRVPTTRKPWGSNPIDQFIGQQLQEHQLTPSPRADRRTLIRRLSLVACGLPPTPGEVEEFLQDSRPDAYERLVDRALASPRYGERWARHWLDVVRFGETHGFETNRERPHAWRYRDYVIQAFNQDLSYQQFVKEQLAGDALQRDAATGFLVAGPYDLVKSRDINLTLAQRQDELADMVNTTGMSFLGLTLGCARCHNHKFDPVTQRDYYSVQAVFAGVEHADRPLAAAADVQLQIAAGQQQVARLTRELAPFLLTAASQWIYIDDAALAKPEGRGTELLVVKRGDGVNPAGTERGFRNDPGGSDWAPNVSQGRYSWWANQSGQDVMQYRLVAPGRYRLWISWGAGQTTHTRSATYLLDDDGDASTRQDQRVVARVDQQRFADGAGGVPGKPLWSGFHDAGVHTLGSSTSLLLRGGEEGAAITADVILLEPVSGSATEKTPTTIQPSFRAAVNARLNTEKLKPTLARSVRFTILATNQSQPCIDELEIWSGDTNVALASHGAVASCSSSLPGHEIHKLKHVHDGQYGNRRSWISNEPGGGWVQIDLPEAVQIDRILWGRDRELKYQDRVATRYRIEVSVEPGKWQVVATGDDRLPMNPSTPAVLSYRFDHLPVKQARRGRQMLSQLEQARRVLAELKTPKLVYAGRFVQPGPTHRLYRGDPQAKREQVNPDTVRFLGTLSLSAESREQDRRLKLACWIVDPANPLTPRVLVNRLWHYHFGRGLVLTPSDFGTQAGVPSHPQLLDWLAREFMDQGWSIKHMQRLIFTSETFCQQGFPRQAAVRVDADSQWLWRFPPRRLEAEGIRDSLLLVAGSLDESMGGPGFSGFEVQMENVRHYFPKTRYEASDWRRMIYMTKVRQELDSVFGLFDCPDGNQVVPRRSRSTTPLQALNLFNSTFVLQQSELFAGQLKRIAGVKIKDQVHHAFLRSLGRAPTSAEQEEAVAFVTDHGLPALCRALVNSNEFVMIP